MSFLTSRVVTLIILLQGISVFIVGCSEQPRLPLNKESHIVLLGNNLGSRMMNFGHFETEMHLRYPDSSLFIRNMSDPGNTPGFRPHAARNTPWAFPGAEQFFEDSELSAETNSQGFYPYPDEWLSRLNADIIVAFFGRSEAYMGSERLDTFKAELKAFIQHTLDQKYNDENAPQLALVSPIAFEDLSGQKDLPDGSKINPRLKMYTEAMREVAEKDSILFVDAFNPTKQWYQESDQPLTIDGSQLNSEGYKKFSRFLADQVFGETERKAEQHIELISDMVEEKNWTWHNDYKIPNGVHAYGRRYNPYGPQNYPYEIAKLHEMTAIRDTAIWRAAKGERMDLQAADARTRDLPEVKSNFNPEAYGHGAPRYLYGEEALESFDMAPGYNIELFASEEDFDDLSNPVQLSFDNEGRLWVAVMPSYPHWKPGDGKPNDKILILEDIDGDGKADDQTIFVDSLQLPVGFELAAEGVYVSQGTNLKLYTDTDGDDRSDTEQIILSGFDDHDTHHAHSAYTGDPSGAIYMGEGVFLHTNVETSYGPVRGSNGGFYRYNPQRHRLERTAQLAIPNPWGIAFDRWGQNFFAETSSPNVRWMMPGTIKPRYGDFSPKSFNLIEEAHMVRPTSGLEFVSSRHFPDEVQGDMLINNTIGFLGTKQHQMIEDGTGYTTIHRQDLVTSTDPNFRPVDIEFAPDGSLYLVDWHNILVGHMQHNARDPYRDHSHGRIYRITYPSRPLVEPANIAEASIDQLLDNLKLPEYRTRYRTRRELRGRNAQQVLEHISEWTANLDQKKDQYEHHLLEALWVTWGLNRVDESLLKKLLKANDHRVRAAAVRVLRYSGHHVEDQEALLMQAAGDDHGRVRLEAIVAASWLDPETGLNILAEAENKPLDEWMNPTFEAARAHLNDQPYISEEERNQEVKTDLVGPARQRFIKGKTIYDRDGSCQQCHQPDGKGVQQSGYPPLAGSRWVTGSEERLIKIVLQGMHGPIEVLGKIYPGQVPMPGFAGMLSDQEAAAVLTYIRNAFGNEASDIDSEKVKQVRKLIEDRKSFYTAEELVKEHPFED